jgi:hypothetical protein
MGFRLAVLLAVSAPLIVLATSLAPISQPTQAEPNAPESYWVSNNFDFTSQTGPQGYCIPGTTYDGGKYTMIAVDMPSMEWLGLLDLSVYATFELYKWSETTQSYYLYTPAYLGRSFVGWSHQGSPSFTYKVGSRVINGALIGSVGGLPELTRFYAPVEAGYYFVRLVLNVVGTTGYYWIPFVGPGAYGYYYCDGRTTSAALAQPGPAAAQLVEQASIVPPPLRYYAYLPYIGRPGSGAPQSTATAPPATATLPVDPLPTPGLPPTTSGMGDPGFEAGPGGAWHEYSSSGYDLVMTGTVGYAPRTGNWMAWLGGAHDEVSILTQTLSVPATHPFLSLYIRAASEEDLCYYDGVTVYANDYVLGKQGLCQATVTSSWERRYLDLRGFAGQTMTLTFALWTDASLLSSIFIDDLSFVSGIEPEEPGPTATPTRTPTPTATHTPTPTSPALPPILNPGFELGDNGDWTTYSQLGYRNIFTSTGAHSGNWLAWLGGSHNEVSYIQQAVRVPAGQPYLTYWGWLVSQETDCSFDRVDIFINGSAIPGYGLCTQTNTGGWGQGWINLGAYAGSTVTVQLRVTTNGASPTTTTSSLFLDDLAFAATVPGTAAEQGYPRATGDRISDQVAPAPGLGSKPVLR